MRGVIENLPSAAPLGLQLPAPYQEDEFALRWVSAFDVALAPILATLDDLDAYIDPHLAPDDFVDWLAGWVGVEFGTAWELPTRREIVANAVRSYRRDGTVAGLRAAVALASGGEVEISESGAASWSRTPGSALPGTAGATLTVRVIVDDPATVSERWLDELIEQIKPAHVVHTVEVVAR